MDNTRNLTGIYILSFIITLLMATASMAGLLFPETFYPTVELRRSFLPNDFIMLLIGVPMLLGSMWLTWRGRMIGLLFWPGALFFALYNYLVYLLGMPLNTVFILSLVLVNLSLYTLISLLSRIKGDLIRQRLSGRVPERLSGGILAGLGLLFFLRAIVTLTMALFDQTAVEETELGLLITDFLIAPSWIVGGLLLWQRRQFGYVCGLGLLFLASMLFIGLILVLLLQPSITGAEFVLWDVIVVFAMGLVCFIPFTLFIRGVVSGKP